MSSKNLPNLLKFGHNDISSDNLIKIYNELEEFKNNYHHKLNHKIEKYSKLIEITINFIIEAEISNNLEIIDTFCSYDFLKLFLELSKLNDYTIDFNIIQSFSILIINLKTKSILYFIFSNNFINFLITKDYSLYGDEFLSYYINFIKSLSIRLDENTIHLFFRRDTFCFPLIESVLKYYNYKDGMVRNVVRNIILNILKIKSQYIEEYFIKLPGISFFANLACQLRDYVMIFDENAFKDNFKKVLNYYDNIIDALYYIQDIFSLNLIKINYVLNNCLFTYFILPVLCFSIINSSPKISINVVLYIFIILFEYIKNENFNNCLFSIIFFEKINEDFYHFINSKTGNDYYSKEFNNQQNNLFSTFISLHYNHKFLLNIQKNKNDYIINFGDKFPQLNEIYEKIKKYESTYKKHKNKTYLDVKDKLVDIINKYLTINEYDLMSSYHKNLTYSTGIKLGTFDMIENKNDIHSISIMCLIHKNFEYNIENKKNNFDNFKENEIKTNLFNFLNSKDDNFILLIQILFYKIRHSNISKILLKKTNFENFDSLVKQEQNNFNLIDYDLNNENNNNIQNNNSEEEFNFSKNNFTYDNNYFLKKCIINLQNDKINFLNYNFNLFFNDPPYRELTLEFILKNIKDSFINKNLETSLQPTNEIFKKINKILFFIINKIIQIISSEKKYRENGYNIFYLTWEIYNKKYNEENFNNKLKFLINKPYIILPINNEIENYPEILKYDLNLHNNQYLNTYLLIFMQIYDLKNMLNNKNNNLIKENFPLKIKDKFKIGEIYSLNSIKNSIKKKVYYIEKNNLLDTSELLLLFHDKIFLIFSEMINENEFKIKYKYKLSNLAMYFNKNDELINRIIVVTDFKTDIKTEIKITFDNPTDCEEVSQYLIDKFIQSKNEEYIHFKTYFDEKLTEITNEFEENENF